MTAADTGPWHRVRVDHAGQAARDEQVRGHDMDEALANAETLWPRDRITYLGADDPLEDAVEDDKEAVEEHEVRDWWDEDYPGDMDDEADADEAA